MAEKRTRERLAAVEATLASRANIEEKVEVSLQAQLDRRLAEADRLQDEKLHGLRREQEAFREAAEEGRKRIEQTADRSVQALHDRLDRSNGDLATRLAAIERITSEDTGARQSVSRLWVAIGAVAALGYLIVLLVTTHVFG